jgi:hypothetical protein
VPKTPSSFPGFLRSIQISGSASKLLTIKIAKLQYTVRASSLKTHCRVTWTSSRLSFLSKSLLVSSPGQPCIHQLRALIPSSPQHSQHLRRHLVSIMKPFPCTALFVLALFALAQAQPLSAPAPSAATSSCVLTPELTEGPYWLDDELLRTNITEGQAGIPFNLSITVKDITSCLPIANAFVDIWHCNATGAYSGFGGNSGAGQGGPGGMGGSGPSTNETFLRGIAVTDADGVATFETIQPGWYQGRTPHIHIKVGPNFGVLWCLCSVPHPKVMESAQFLLSCCGHLINHLCGLYSCFWVPTPMINASGISSKILGVVASDVGLAVLTKGTARTTVVIRSLQAKLGQPVSDPPSLTGLWCIVAPENCGAVSW